MNCMLRSTWPATRADPVRSAPLPARLDRDVLRSVKPSATSNSSAIHWGARQVLGTFVSRSRVVSGGGSAAVNLGCRGPRRGPAVPSSVIPPRNLRRLNGLACWILISTSLPEASQYDSANPGQWTLLPSDEQVRPRRVARWACSHPAPKNGASQFPGTPTYYARDYSAEQALKNQQKSLTCAT